MKDKRNLQRKQRAWLPLYNKIFLDNARVLRFYERLGIPSDYLCKKCGASGVKLWRIYQSSYINLLCLPCAEKETKSFCKYSNCAQSILKEWQDLWDFFSEDNSMSLDTPYKQEMSSKRMNATCDQIGSYVPAVPDETLTTYYGYTSVPMPGVDWWKRLPLVKEVNNADITSV